jgi:hypothetical protein
VSLNFDYALRRFSTRDNYDPIFLITTSLRIPTPTRHLCLPHLLRGSLVVGRHLPHTDSEARGQSILVSFSFLHPPADSKPIAPPFQNGFLQVAVSKTLRHSAFRNPGSFIRLSVSDTALGLPARVVSGTLPRTAHAEGHWLAASGAIKIYCATDSSKYCIARQAYCIFWRIE